MVIKSLRIKRCSRGILHVVSQEQARQLLALPIRQGYLQLEMERVMKPRPLHYPTTNQGGVKGDTTQCGHDQVRLTIRKVSHDIHRSLYLRTNHCSQIRCW